MEHILILISILLLSSPLFGQSKKSDLLYTWENGSRYVGEWKDGKKHGQGTYFWSDGRKQNEVWKSGKLVNKKEQKSNETVKYEEGKGVKIDGNALNKAFKKKECMNVAKLLPASDRVEYLRSCGVID